LTGYLEALHRRWQPTAVSMVVCAALGAVLRGLLQPGSATGPWTWSLLGALCAAGVGLAWSLPAVRRGAAGVRPAADGDAQAQVLARLTARRGSVRRWGLAAGLAVVVSVAVFVVYRAASRPLEGAARPAQIPAQARQPRPSPPGLAPRPQPTIRIGTYILVRAPHRPALSR
jgi:hypothetical protein